MPFFGPLKKYSSAGPGGPYAPAPIATDVREPTTSAFGEFRPLSSTLTLPPRSSLPAATGPAVLRIVAPMIRLAEARLPTRRSLTAVPPLPPGGRGKCRRKPGVGMSAALQRPRPAKSAPQYISRKATKRMAGAPWQRGHLHLGWRAAGVAGPTALGSAAQVPFRLASLKSSWFSMGTLGSAQPPLYEMTTSDATCSHRFTHGPNETAYPITTANSKATPTNASHLVTSAR